MGACDGFTVYEWARESGLKKEKPWSKAPFTAFFNSLISWLVRSEWERFFYEEEGEKKKNRRLGQPGGEERGKTRGKGIFATVPSSSPNPALLRDSLVFAFGSVKRACPMEKTVWKGSVERGRGAPRSLTFRGHWLGSLPVWALGQRGLHGGAAWGSLSGTASNAGKMTGSVCNCMDDV